MKVDKTSHRILEILKRNGPTSQDRLSGELGLSTMAVSKHLNAFLQKGIVEFKEERRDRGRPIKQWKVTAKANEHFPNAHAPLAVSLLTSAKQALGDEAMTSLFSAHTKSKVEQYAKALAGQKDLAGTLKKFAELRNDEGYLAEFHHYPADNSYEIIENHCPICDVASFCGDLCQSELDVMKTLFGDVDIERTEHIQNDERRCAYRIRPASE